VTALGTVERVKGVGQAKTYRLHPGQWDTWTATERYVAMIAGTGGGKTSFGPLWLWREIQARGAGDYLAISPISDMLSRVLIPALMGLLESQGCTWEKAAGKIVCPNGAEIFLISADRPERAEGIHAQGAWIDEAGQMAHMMWEVARRRVAHHRGRVLLTTTPYNMGWLKTEVSDRAAGGEAEYKVVTFSSTANPDYPVEEFERARRELPPDRFAMFYLGEFRRASGLVYPDWSPARMLIDREQMPASVREIGGLDLGWHNPTAGLVLAQDADGAVYVTAEHYAAEQTLADHATALNARGRIRWYADPSAAQSIEELRKLGVWITPAENDVAAGIDAVTRLLRTDRLRVVRGAAPNLLREFESYVWEQRDGVTLDRPKKADDHALDALRYGVMALGGKRGMQAW
jgi:phage terminase large subunit